MAIDVFVLMKKMTERLFYNPQQISVKFMMPAYQTSLSLS